MSSLTRFEPFRDLLSMRDMLDRWMEEGLDRPRAGYLLLGAPAVDMYQTDDEIVVKATVPGVRPEALSLTVTGDALTIRGEINEDAEHSGATYHVRERRYGSFARTLALPLAVVADKARADFENGVLTLTLPKAEELKPKTITVRAR
jgi:HSP20 family protein